MCKEARAAKLLLTHLLQCGPSSQTHLMSRNDSNPNQLIVAVDVLAVTEVQVKAFGSCTTFRSLIMEKQTSADTLSSMAVGSVQCHIAQFRQTADILKPGYALPDCNLPQISRASCQMVVFPSLPPCCRSASHRLYNSTPPLQSLNHGYRAINQSGVLFLEVIKPISHHCHQSRR